MGSRGVLSLDLSDTEFLTSGKWDVYQSSSEKDNRKDIVLYVQVHVSLGGEKGGSFEELAQTVEKSWTV